jgi:hypothetical protein
MFLTPYSTKLKLILNPEGAQGALSTEFFGCEFQQIFLLQTQEMIENEKGR